MDKPIGEYHLRYNNLTETKQNETIFRELGNRVTDQCNIISTGEITGVFAWVLESPENKIWLHRLIAWIDMNFPYHLIPSSTTIRLTVDISTNIFYCFLLQYLYFFHRKKQFTKVKVDLRTVKLYLLHLTPVFVANAGQDFIETTMTLMIHLYCVTALLFIFKLQCTFLQRAIKLVLNGSLSAVFTPVPKRIDISTTHKVSNYGKRLYNAASTGDLKTVEKLIKFPEVSHVVNTPDGEQVESPDILQNAIYKAVCGGSLKVVRLLLQHQKQSNQAIGNYNLLHTATYFSHARILAYLLDNIPELKIDIDKITDDDTLLTLATKHRSLKCFQVLITRGADVTVKDSIPFSVLQIAACANNNDIVAYIYKKFPFSTSKAIQNQLNTNDDYPINLALENEHWYTANLIVKNTPVNLDGVMHENGTLLHIIYQYYEVHNLAEDIIKRGCNVNRLDSDQNVAFCCFLELWYDEKWHFDDSLLPAADILCQHIRAGLDTNLLKIADQYNISLIIKNIFTAYENTQDEYQVKLFLRILHESGFTFHKEHLTSLEEYDFARFVQPLISEPLSLQQLCGNAVRIRLKPNVPVALPKLCLPNVINKLVTLEDIDVFAHNYIDN